MAASGGCLLWVRGKDRDGYGVFSLYGASRRAHRLAYELMRGPIPDGLVIDHLCKMPACINPSHMEAVTNGENVRRGEGPYAVNARKTHCVNGHELTEENSYGPPSAPTVRYCRTCRRLRGRERDRRRRTADPAGENRKRAERKLRAREQSQRGASSGD